MEAFCTPLDALPGDVVALVVDNLVWTDIRTLILAGSSTRNAVLSSDKLWASYLQKQFPRVPRGRSGTEGRFLRTYVGLHDRSFQASQYD
jgi:hypothetical protein